MKKTFKIFAAAAALTMCFAFAGCAKAGGENGIPLAPGWAGNMVWNDGIFGTAGSIGDSTGDGMSGGNYQYGEVIEYPFITVNDQTSSSYFSLDRNTACYSYVRTQIQRDLEVRPDSVRVEELINYFDYSYPSPENEAMAVTAYLSDCPWNSENKLVTVGVKTQSFDLSTEHGNYVLLIDVSDSMSGANRIGLAKKGFNMLVDSLGGGDVVSVVTYASGMDVILDGVECVDNNKQKIKNAVNGLNAYGSTNGQGGLELAYQTAQKHYIEGGNNRIILISDGDFNVGSSTVDKMKEFIQQKAKTGTYLSVIGVGMGNTRDDMLETLATCGNGNYAYMDGELEAQKIFLHDLSGNLKTVAKDAKAGVTFTDNVQKFRLIGYDTKHMDKEDFENEKKDAGEVGSGLCATAVYEVTLKENASGEIAKAEIKYKDVLDGEKSKSVFAEVTTESTASLDVEYVACVAEFGLILRNSEFKGQASLSNVSERLQNLSQYIANDPFKQEFVTLVGRASENSSITQ